ncbi:MAG: site-specific DNA-methyltransferase [Anaerolinea sp.]|nr:site-specific DNA-methyltransferase [Anaerolinea sp.]
MNAQETYQANKNRLSTALGRWMGIGPYYAMFPISFTYEVVQRFCPPGGSVLDPFAGRASSIYAASTTGRFGLGIEINKVGWLYGRVKLDPAPLEDVLKRHHQIGKSAAHLGARRLKELPEFFKVCYTDRVLKYLLAVREKLDWQENNADATLMAIILVYLHGAKEKSLSNQMRQGKAMAPEYSLGWWRSHCSTPPDVDPVTFLEQRIRWRYVHGLPQYAKQGSVILGDSVTVLDQLQLAVSKGEMPKFDLLFTSPPYYGITSYHYDQWLRLWLLGGSPTPSKTGGDWQNGFWSKANYRSLLEQVFRKCTTIMSPNATVYVRTDARSFTQDTTIEVLRNTFPEKQLRGEKQPIRKQNQTALYGDKSEKPGEIDIILE